MKLVVCLECNDVFNLSYESKSCSCGRTTGQYLDTLHAVYSGERALPLGFANNSFREALQNQPDGPGMGKSFEAFVIPHVCGTFVHIP